MVKQQRLFGIAAMVMFAAALVSAGSRCWLLQRTPDNPHHPNRTALCDFQDVVYYPARAALAGVNPYDPRPANEGGQYFAHFPAGNPFPLYAPLILVASLPFAIMDLTAAEVLYWIFNVGLLVLYSYVLLRIAARGAGWQNVVALATLLLASRPGNANVYFGAIALPMALATVGSWRLAERRPWISAFLLAVACIKPTFGGPLFVLLLIRGCYRAALAGLGIAVIANVAVAAVLLPQLLNVDRLLELVSINQAATEANAAVDPLLSASRVDLPMVVERLIGQHLPDAIRYAMTFAMVIIAGVAMRRCDKTDAAGKRHVGFQSMALAAVTITLCIYHNIYDALLIAPAAMAAVLGCRKNETGARDSLNLLLSALLLVPAANYLTSEKFVRQLAQIAPPLAGVIQHPTSWTVLCVVNGVCLTIAWAILLFRCLRKNETAAVQASK